MPNVRGVVAYGPHSRPTATLLARALEAACVSEVSQEPMDYLVRWGNTDPVHGPCGVMINSLAGIRAVSNKYLARLNLLACGIPCPAVYGPYNSDALQGAAFPLIARPYYHWGGRGWDYVANLSEAWRALRRGCYLQEIRDTIQEYRVFLWRGTWFEAASKVSPAVRRVKNHGTGYRFQRVLKRNVPASVIQLSQEVSRVVHGARWDYREGRDSTGGRRLDFMALDIGMDNTGPILYEINSAPGLVPRKVDKLCGCLKIYLRECGVPVDV